MKKLWKIRIVKIPDGEAPAWVRAAWIGVEIPVDVERYEQPSYQAAGGALTNEYLGQKLVYIVSSFVALSALELMDKNAHRWWQQNKPEYFGPSRTFLFDSTACEYIGTPMAHFQRASSAS